MDRVWCVVVGPTYAVHLCADEMTVGDNTGLLTFRRGGQVCAVFPQYMGWYEIFGAEKKSATILKLVPNNDPPAA